MVVFSLAIFFLLGYFFKVYFSYSEEQAGQILSRIILYVTIPATIFYSTSTTQDLSHAFFLPVVAILIQSVMFVIFYFLARRLKLEPDTECVFATTPLTTNILLFMGPFFYLSYGDSGFTRLILFDMGNIITSYCLAQPIFRSTSQRKLDILLTIKIMLRSIPIWAFIIGLIFGTLGLTIPDFLQGTLRILKEANIFLPMFMLGFYFRPSLKKIRLVLFTVSLRMLLGLMIGVGISFLFPNPMDKVTVIMCTSAPIGLMGLIFSSEYRKDTTFSSTVVSYSMLIGLFLTFILDEVFKAIGLI
jgi:malate permease and related proteins